MKIKILACAFACVKDPDKRYKSGGEGILGLNIVKQIGRFYEVWILTHSGNRAAIEETLKKQLIPNLHFYYFHLFPFLEFLRGFAGGMQLYAYLWQIKAYFVSRRLHRKHHFDLFHHVTYANDWMASFIGALLPIPYIRGSCGGAHKVPKNFLPEFSLKSRIAQYLRTFGQWLFRHDPFFILSQKRARAILVCNREAQRIIPKRWQHKTYIFPVNGVSSEDLALLDGEKKSGDNFSVLSAGKLLSIKGFDLAIKAFKIFSQKTSNAELTIVGDGPEFTRLKKLVFELGLEKQVHFTGWMARKELLRMMPSFDVFVFPSLRDGGGAVVVEAMAAGLPVICLNIGGPGFHIQEEWGIKIEPKDPEYVINEMAKALEKLYFDKSLREKLSRAARKRAEEFYLWDRLGEQMQEIYRCTIPELFR